LVNPDGWTAATDFPDKAVHAIASSAITGGDVAADCAGAIGAATWQSWRARRKARAASQRRTD